VDLAASILPDFEPWIVSEALIELGALVCKKEPNCGHCPLQKECKAYQRGLQRELPKKRSRPQTIHVRRTVGVILCGERVLVRKGEKGKVMADLYEFPYVDAKSSLEEELQLPLRFITTLPEQKHTFTRYRATLFPHLFRIEKMDKRYQWKKKRELADLPFSSGHRRILNHLLSNEQTYFTH